VRQSNAKQVHEKKCFPFMRPITFKNTLSARRKAGGDGIKKDGRRIFDSGLVEESSHFGADQSMAEGGDRGALY